MTLSRPARPKLLGIAQRVISMDRSRRFFVGSEPGQNKWNALSCLDSELSDGGQILASGLNRRSQNQTVWTGNRFHSAVTLSHPRHDVAIVEPYDQVHFQIDLTAQSLDDSNDVGIFSAGRHEIDQPHGSTGRFNFRFQNQRITAISPFYLLDLFLRKKSPMTILPIA